MARRSLTYEVASRLPPSVLRWIGRAQFRSRTVNRLVEQARRKMSGAEVRIRHGEAAGMWIAPFQANPGYALGTSEPHVQRFLAVNLRAGQVFYDVGANVGFLTLVGARAVGQSGRVYSFEPLPDNVAALKHNVGLNRLSQVEIIEAAVADESGSSEFAIGTSTTSRLASSHATTENRHFLVPTVSLDDAVTEMGFAPPDVVKIDVEGAESRVLRGMGSVISTFHPVILCEIHEQTTPIGVVEKMASAMVGDRHGMRYALRETGAWPVAFIPGLDYRISLLELDHRERDAEIWAGHAVATPLSTPATPTTD
jgi:FkbM family methyltransferase